MGSLQRVGLDAFLGEVERGTSGRLGLMAQDNSPLLARARCEGLQSVTFSFGRSVGPLALCSVCLKTRLDVDVLLRWGIRWGKWRQISIREIQWWSQEYFRASCRVEVTCDMDVM
jgi:hypothetical protein